MSKFYTYIQNNSYGVFKGPAQYVIIEAEDSERADDIACDHGLYFDGVAKGIDCYCCGDRWRMQWEEGADEPQIYGVDVARAEERNVAIIIRLKRKEETDAAR